MRTTTKTIVAALALSLSFMPLGGCAQRTDTATDTTPATTSEAGAATADISSLKTLGDVLAIESELEATAWDENHYICALVLDGTPMRVVADITDEQCDQINDLDFLDESYADKVLEIVGSAPISSVEDLSAELLTPEEQEALKGKTGQDLINAGFEFQGFDMVGEYGTRANFDRGSIRFSVEFNEMLDSSIDMDDASRVNDLTVKTIQFVDFASSALDPTLIG